MSDVPTKATVVVIGAGMASGRALEHLFDRSLDLAEINRSTHGMEEA